MTMFSSTVQILSVEDEMRDSKKTPGTQWRHHVARAVLLNDDGSVNTVGALQLRNVPESIRKAMVPGTTGFFRASYGLQVLDFGDAKGEIAAVLTSLLPIPAGSLPVAPAVRPAAVVK